MANDGPSDRVQNLLVRLKTIAYTARCASCGGSKWDFVETPVMLVAPPDGGFEVFPLVCQGCGHANLYSTQHLEGTPRVLGSVKPLDN